MTEDTRTRLLHEAETLIRTRGYAAFSYADLSERLGISKPSVHHHFPSKEALMTVLLAEYVVRFKAALAAILEKHASAGARLRAYGQLFFDGFEKGMLPLCGALSAERAALPPALHPEVTDFFRIHLDWLDIVLADGIRRGELRPQTRPADAGMLLLSTLEGGSFVAWALQDTAPVLASFETALRELETPSPRSKKK
jgi:TetR/AcrR family transcriptional repressor of nem operon